MGEILYRQGLPWETIKQYRMGHIGTGLCAKHDGITGKEIYNDKGVFRRSPISALLFAIYFGDVVKIYENNLPGEIKNAMPEMEIRNGRADHA